MNIKFNMQKCALQSRHLVSSYIQLNLTTQQNCKLLPPLRATKFEKMQKYLTFEFACLSPTLYFFNNFEMTCKKTKIV